MEPASLATGIIALAGLFNNAVDCFEYVQLGRKFGKDFQTSLLKLDNARLRLSRWGQSIGLSGDLQDVQTLNQTLVSAENVKKADERLSQILELFADAEGVSAKFKSRTKPDDATLLEQGTGAGLDPVAASLHQKMRELSIKRQNQTSLRQKTKWALYEEKHFRRLIEDTTDLVDGLVELFPAAQVAQRNLCEIEVSEMGTDESLSVLKDVAADQDAYLEDAVLKAIERRMSQSGGSNAAFYGANYGMQLHTNTGTMNNTFGRG
ncbi:hypothetical protein H2199_003973 [Coniosporium tulheliwenetii]|uniref:Uncharacterized protein n=1 Tax=Coniosporium tulheliwenetii TaxID=3383036 RepID=A0ACC2Z9C3_9PEZI|nr:hypothetical protein H2199_003973 [Cladosporium sp. JES 115]